MKVRANATDHRWTAVTASVMGASHQRTGLPNQDAVAVAAVEGPVPGTVAAVADGHGGSRYVRSDRGSRLAVAIACEIGARLLGELVAESAPTEEVLHRRFAPVVVERWRSAVEDDVHERPFDLEEQQRGGVDLDADPLIAYGCTLIVALLGSNWVALLQVGDGDALVVGDDGSVSDPVPGDDRLVGGETTSLCLPSAVDDARVVVLPTPMPALVVLASDGYGNSFASPDWRQDAGTGLFGAVRKDGLDDVASRLPDWLAESAAASGDDVTMALVQRQSMTTGGSSVPPLLPSVPTAGKRPRKPFLIGAIVATGALLLGGVLGWFAGDSAGSTAITTTVPLVVPEIIPAPELAETEPILESILIGGRVITFSNTLVDGEVRPKVTLENSSIEPTAEVQDPKVRVEGVTLLLANGNRVPMGREGVAVRVIDDVIWVAADNGAVRAFRLENGEAMITWQPVVNQ